MDPSWEWHVGDPIGFGNDVGAPEVPYMSYGPNVKDEEELEKERKSSKLRSRSVSISMEAWKLHEEGRNDEALIFINRALECWDRIANTWNRKGIILESLNRYDEAVECYTRATGLSRAVVFAHNKAACLIDYGYSLWNEGDVENAMGRTDEALEIFGEIDDKRCEDEAWNLKGMICEHSGDIAEAFSSYKKALELAGDDNANRKTYTQNRDRILAMIDDGDIECPNCGNHLKVTDNFCLRCGSRIDVPVTPRRQNFKKTIIPGEGNLEATIYSIDEETTESPYGTDMLMAIGRENLITIAGTGIYGLEDRLVEGASIMLVKEPDNVHDSDAIAVYRGDELVGYVSNSPGTNSPFSSQASELKDIPDVSFGQYLLEYDGTYHVAMIFRQ